VQGEEVRAGLAKVLYLTGFGNGKPGNDTSGGDAGGDEVAA
jgi:hypothetical protein